MTVVELSAEKSQLEIFLNSFPGDSAILHTLHGPGFESFDHGAEEYTILGNDYNAQGKLIRYSRTESLKRQTAKAIRESSNFLLFHRLRLINAQLLLPSNEEAQAVQANDSELASDSLWSGYFRVNQNAPLTAPNKFLSQKACVEWAHLKADEFRMDAYAFNYECRRGLEVFKEKLW